MNLLTRVKRAVDAFSAAPGKTTDEKINFIVKNNQVEILPDTEVSKEIQPNLSKLAVRHQDTDMSTDFIYAGMRGFIDTISRLERKEGRNLQAPSHTDSSRDAFMATVWMLEPILAGAVYSMSAKVSTLGWAVTGKRKQAREAAMVLSNAGHGGGYDWNGFMSGTAQDFFTTNRGAFWELSKQLPDAEWNRLASLFYPENEIRVRTAAYGKLKQIGHVDSLACRLTGNSNYPVEYYSSETGQSFRFIPGEFSHFSSLPSAREGRYGGGFCAVDRAYRAAKLLISLHDYDEQKLSNLPPEGVATVTGLTKEEFLEALTLWQTERMKNQSLTFPQLLWLMGSNPDTNVKIEMVPFSTLPESFDRKTVVDQYIQTLALDFGVDVREFWALASSTLAGNATESSIQHLKARGKGAGELTAIAEREINGELPETAEFKFDVQDSEEDANHAATAKAWIDAFMPLYNMPIEETVSKANPRPQHSDGSPTLPVSQIPRTDTGGTMSINNGRPTKQATQVIDKDDLIRLLVERRVLPEWISSDERMMIEDVSARNNVIFKGSTYSSDEDATCFYFDGKVIKEKRLPAITLNSPVVVKEDPNIKGKPISDKEVDRGNKPTKKGVTAEIDLWRTNPELKPYAPTQAEESKLVDSWFVQ